MKRKDLLKLYDHLYEFKAIGDRMKCVYCGDVREEIDHMPSLSVVDYVTPQALRDKNIKFFKVPACKACNQALSNKHLANYEERLMFLYNRLQDKLESAVLWTEKEVEEAELKGDLKRLVLARSANLKREFFTRLRGMEENIVKIESLMLEFS